MCRSAFHCTILSLALALLSPVAAHPQVCFDAGLIEFAGGDLTGAEQIQQIWTEGADLLVELRWGAAGSPYAAWVLSTPAGVDVGSWEMPRIPGLVEKVRLEGALSQVATEGFQYRLRLEDADGVHFDRPLRVKVECPAKKPCHFGLHQGLATDAITVSEALGDALIRVYEDGSSDLLADVRDQYPDLVSQVPGLVWQMEQARPLSATDCQCEWLTVEDEISTPPSNTGSYSENPQVKLHHSIQSVPGAGFRAGAQARDAAIGISNSDTWGRTTLGLALFCTSISGQQETDYENDWGPEPLTLGERQVAACPLPCTPRIEHNAWIEGCASGLAVGRADQRSVSTATLGSTLWLNVGSLPVEGLVTGTATVDVEAPLGQTLRDMDAIYKWSRDSHQAPGVRTQLEVAGSIVLDSRQLQPISGSNYVFGTLALEYNMQLSAAEEDQVCQGIPDGWASSIYEDNSGTDGGVVIERWEDP